MNRNKKQSSSRFNLMDNQDNITESMINHGSGNTSPVNKNKSRTLRSLMSRKKGKIISIVTIILLLLIAFVFLGKRASNKKDMVVPETKTSSNGVSTMTPKPSISSLEDLDSNLSTQQDDGKISIKNTPGNELLENVYKTVKSNINDLNIKKGELLTPLLITRPVGSEGHKKTIDFISKKLKEFGFSVSLDSFLEKTPLGMKSFTNIIGIKNPKAKKRVVLAAHFDSKVFNTGDFIGAIDSAVPVAILLSICKNLGKMINGEDKTLQVIFFDGEEAFVDWTETDSLYGSRHLAAKWSDGLDEITAKAAPNLSTNELSLMEVFVLLDLIGTSDVIIPPLQTSTLYLFYQLSEIESRLYKLEYITKKHLNPARFVSGQIDDDHRPFAKKNIPVLHLISSPFPKVWHTLGDNAENLDQESINSFNVLMSTFVAAYLDLKV
ncbi:hypothetical protein BB559_003911 [Furculomyces boomerangus]|uniref:Peptide hydrolase n=1 Tax=Furculomyces boomerangus TaxID=61424 RepID=A0A2T9YHY6_9FUNG|nr:hypothetical protein BB559_003911 [Furculomyces boomerangus]